MIDRRAFVGASLLACAPLRAAPAPRDLLVQAFSFDDIISLDPHEGFEISSGEIHGNTYQRLLRFELDDPSKLHGQIASAWSLGADACSYRFELPPGLRFATGNPLMAEDVVFSFKRAVLLDKAPAFILNQLGLTKDRLNQSVMANGPLTLTLVTAQPFAPSFVLNCLTAVVASVVDRVLLLAKQVDGDLGHAYARRNNAGSGAFSLREWRANEIITLDRNDNFHGPRPALARVIYRHVKEATTQRLLLQRGDVDVARNLTPQDIDAVNGAPGIALTRADKGGLVYFSLNQKHPILARPQVREAFKWLVDYEALGETLIRHIGRPWQNFLPNGLLGASNAMPFHLDVDRARKLLAEAGLPNGFDVSMDVRSVEPIQGVAEAIQQWVARAGIRMQLLPGDGKQTLTRYRARKQDIYIGDWSVDYWDPQSNADAFAHNVDNSDAAAVKPLAWRNAWNIPVLSRQTEAALLERDTAKRAAEYDAIQAEFRRRSPFVMLYQQIQVAAMRSNVHGYRLGPTADSNWLETVSKT